MFASAMPTISIALDDTARNYDDGRDGRCDADMNAEEIRDRKGDTSRPSRRETQLPPLDRTVFDFYEDSLKAQLPVCQTDDHRRRFGRWKTAGTLIDRSVHRAQTESLAYR